jgi:uncharacterized membrane protein YdbT with pleckstrin-like domain
VRYELEARVEEEEVAGDAHVSSRGLIASVISDAQRLVALEVALAKQETKELATANGIALGVITFGGLLVMLAILVALPVMVVMLVPWKWEAAAIWAAAYIVIGVVMVIVGRARLQFRLPPKTIESLKENKEWALRRVRSNGR